MSVQKNRFNKHPRLTWLLTLAVFALISELTLRIIKPDILEFAYNFRQIYNYHERWYTDFKPNTSTRIKLKDSLGNYFFNFVVTVNEFGFRSYDRKLDYDLARVDDKQKIIHAIGDSFTMGWGVNYEASYPAILEFITPRPYRVLNLGLNGYGTIAAVEKSRQVSRTFPPDAVVYLATENDYSDDLMALSHASRPGLVHQAYDVLNWLRQNTYLASVPFAIYWWTHFRDAIVVSDKDFPISKTSYISNQHELELLDIHGASNPNIGADSKKALLAYYQQLKQREIPMLVIAHGTGTVARDIASFCKEHGIPAYSVKVPKQLKLVKEGHFNHIGNHKLSLLVYDILKSHNVF